MITVLVIFIQNKCLKVITRAIIIQQIEGASTSKCDGVLIKRDSKNYSVTFFTINKNITTIMMCEGLDNPIQKRSNE
jgi:hypothetical protein